MHDNYASSEASAHSHETRVSEELIEPPATTVTPSNHDGEPHSEDDSISNVQPAEKHQKSESQEPSVPLKRTLYPVFLVLVYCVAAIYAWVVLCILSCRPISGVDYGFDQVKHIFDEESHRREGPGFEGTMSEYLNRLYHKSEKYLKAARVVQSLVSVVTIPLTSAVCSQAAVVYIQRKRANNRPTLRQSMALADKGWTDLNLIGKLFFGGWKKYGSALLTLGLFVHLLGFAVSPVQQLFLSYKTIKRVSSNYQYLGPITDMNDFYTIDGSQWPDDGINTVTLRSKLEAASSKEIQTRLWSRGNATLSVSNNSWDEHPDNALQAQSQKTLVNMTGNPDLFWAQMPTTTNTGLVQQFAPRINSTAKWENVTDHELPADCDPSSDAFYIHYMYQFHDIFGYDIKICMPGNMTKSPWKNERSRQDFGEELYMRMNFTSDGSDLSLSYIKPGVYTKRLTLQTTRGNFELPNYANGGTPGPLVDEDPYPNPGENTGIFQGSKLFERSMVNDTSWNIYNATKKLLGYQHKGPLLSTALALFGEGSLVDTQHTKLAAYVNSDVPATSCIGSLPFISLIDNGNPTQCLDMKNLKDYVSISDIDDVAARKQATMQSFIASYFFVFTGMSLDVTDTMLENAFAASAFLANDAMMRDPSLKPTGAISYVAGVDMQIPSISLAGKIVVSILLGLDILCLFAIAIYSAWIPRWTPSLDSFAMMRIGASISEKVPLLATNHAEGIKTLDETPGWIGNKAEGLDTTGQLCLGGVRPLKETRCYAGYETDRTGQSSATKEPPTAFKRGGYSLAAPGENV